VSAAVLGAVVHVLHGRIETLSVSKKKYKSSWVSSRGAEWSAYIVGGKTEQDHFILPFPIRKLHKWPPPPAGPPLAGRRTGRGWERAKGGHAGEGKRI